MEKPASGLLDKSPRISRPSKWMGWMGKISDFPTVLWGAAGFLPAASEELGKGGITSVTSSGANLLLSELKYVLHTVWKPQLSITILEQFKKSSSLLMELPCSHLPGPCFYATSLPGMLASPLVDQPIPIHFERSVNMPRVLNTLSSLRAGIPFTRPRRS